MLVLSGGINKIIPKTELLFKLEFIGKATSNFVFERLFKLNFSETVGRTNFKLGTIDHHLRVNVIWGLMMS